MSKKSRGEYLNLLTQKSLLMMGMLVPKPTHKSKKTDSAILTTIISIINDSTVDEEEKIKFAEQCIPADTDLATLILIFECVKLHIENEGSEYSLDQNAGDQDPLIMAILDKIDAASKATTDSTFLDGPIALAKQLGYSTITSTLEKRIEDLLYE